MQFWWQTRYASWEETSFRVFRHFVRPGAVVLDLGGWVGPTALWLAAVARKVVVLEPGDKAFDELTLNAAANRDRIGRLSLVHAALGPKRGFVQMTNRGDSADQVGVYDGQGGILSAVWSVKDLLWAFPELEEVTFVKIDVEGSERDIIPAMAGFLREKQPVMLLSIHPWALMADELEDLASHLKDLCPFLYSFHFNMTWSLTDFRIMGPTAAIMPQVADPADDVLCMWQSAPELSALPIWS
ncbi:unnamed protein product [Effrenium voratum]|uniref:Methyltransferase FkbM domain-containing protein n=1 Tax=Effrenium voratum TaxID=2562239 RepID=A0AA36MGQ6_9DINO|nr:unnamed protein product [Effrenium voratum]